MSLVARLLRLPLWAYLLIGAGVIVLAASIELAMGRPPICKCGYVHFWVGKVNSSENSQQIADWYSFSHIIHGFAFYGLFRWISRGRWPVGLCFLATVVVEAGWEVLENSSFIIERYRKHTLSLDYYGDSVLNSMSDILFCVLGFWLARYLPVWVTITLVIAMEVGVGLAIRDNLTLNIIMLIHPFETIKRWQMGGG